MNGIQVAEERMVKAMIAIGHGFCSPSSMLKARWLSLSTLSLQSVASLKQTTAAANKRRIGRTVLHRHRYAVYGV